LKQSKISLHRAEIDTGRQGTEANKLLRIKTALDSRKLSRSVTKTYVRQIDEVIKLNLRTKNYEQYDDDSTEDNESESSDGKKSLIEYSFPSFIFNFLFCLV